MIYVVPNYCFLVANYTLSTEALSFTDATHFLIEIHTVFCTAITDTFRMCEHCPFGKSISAKLSFGLSRFSQLHATELEKEGRI